jgi:hypothetical protein
MNTDRHTPLKLMFTALALLCTSSCQQAPTPANNLTAATPTSQTMLTTAAPKPPAGQSTKDNNPCWVHIWEDENFEDDNDVIFGPGRWNNMRNLPGANKSDWGDEIDSLKVGPAATVTVWEDENFGDNSQTYGPGAEKTNLRGNPDMGDTIDSMEIKCR